MKTLEELFEEVKKICIYCREEFDDGESLIKHVKKEHIGLVQSAFFEGGFGIEKQELDWRAFDDIFQQRQIKEIMLKMAVERVK